MAFFGEVLAVSAAGRVYKNVLEFVPFQKLLQERKLDVHVLP